MLGLTVIVALPLPATALGADGVPGASKVHFAISVTLFVVVLVKCRYLVKNMKNTYLLFMLVF